MAGGSFTCKKLDSSGKCIVLEQVADIKGQLYWNRTWDYNDSSTNISPVKEYLPGAKVRLKYKRKGEKKWTFHGTEHLTDGVDKPLTDSHSTAGKFEFKDIPKCRRLALEIHLEYKGRKIVWVKGMTYQTDSAPVKKSDFRIEDGKTVWHSLKIDPSKIFGKKKEVDLGEIEIKPYPRSNTGVPVNRTDFVHLCDSYKSVWFGYKRLVELSSRKVGVCVINYPEDDSVTVSNAGTEMYLIKQDLLDRAVILHEYGHFVEIEILGDNGFSGYDYEATGGYPGGHTDESEEHYETSWAEAFANFMSSALRDDEHYHDGYDANLDTHLAKTDIQVGPHAEGSVQQALWRIYKIHSTDFKAGFWKAFSDRSNRTCLTIFDFFSNWRALKLGKLDKVIEAFKKLNMAYGYEYFAAADGFTCVQADKGPLRISKYDEALREFATVEELFDVLGRSGKLDEYKEEFYNRNKYFGGGAMGGGSSYSDPKVIVGNTYIIPAAFEVKK